MLWTRLMGIGGSAELSGLKHAKGTNALGSCAEDACTSAQAFHSANVEGFSEILTRFGSGSTPVICAAQNNKYTKAQSIHEDVCTLYCLLIILHVPTFNLSDMCNKHNPLKCWQELKESTQSWSLHAPGCATLGCGATKTSSTHNMAKEHERTG